MLLTISMVTGELGNTHTFEIHAGSWIEKEIGGKPFPVLNLEHLYLLHKSNSKPYYSAMREIKEGKLSKQNFSQLWEKIYTELEG